jgi:hypothetical protein
MKGFNKILNESYYENRKDVDNYIDANDIVGHRVWVHTNRTHRNNGLNGMIGIYGVNSRGKKTGKPLFYTNEIRIKDPIVFQTSKKGSEKIVKTGHRTLIAGVSGEVIPITDEVNGFDLITYSPFVGYFYSLSDPMKREIINASEIYFYADEDGKYYMYADGIEYLEDDSEPEDVLDEQEEGGETASTSSGGGETTSSSSAEKWQGQRGWENVTRGPANPISNTNIWSSNVSRGPANPL